MTIAVCVSRASVGKATFFGCTVVSTTTRSRPLGPSAPVLCATERLLLKQRRERRLAEPPAPARQRRTVKRQPMLEALLAAEELIIGVLDPARAQRLVRQIVHVLEDQQPGHQPRRQRRLTGPGPARRAETAIEKIPVDLLRQPRQRMTEIDDLIQGRPQQVFLAGVARLAHRSSPKSRNPDSRESRTAQNGNPKSQEIPANPHGFLQTKTTATADQINKSDA